MGQWDIVTCKRMKVANINIMEKSYRKTLSPVVPPPSQFKEKGSLNSISQLPAPPGWHSTSELTREVSTMESNAEIKEAELKWKVLNGKVKTATADDGALASCGRPELSVRGNYKLDSDPFIATSRKSDKIFQYAGGTKAEFDEIKNCHSGYEKKHRMFT